MEWMSPYCAQKITAFFFIKTLTSKGLDRQIIMTMLLFFDCWCKSKMHFAKYSLFLWDFQYSFQSLPAGSEILFLWDFQYSFQSLPAGSEIYGGFLRIPRVSLSDEGRYTCIVDTPGQTEEQHVLLHVLEPTGLVGQGLCAQDEATCSGGQCIPRDFLCDGDYDCPSRSDEINCSKILWL